MILLISFNPGSSGNFLADFLSTTSVGRAPSFRIDTASNVMTENPHRCFLSSGASIHDNRISDHNDINKIEENLKLILASAPRQIITHCRAVTRLKNQFPELEIIKIYPLTNIFGLIKNQIFKKVEAEFTNLQFVKEMGIKIDDTLLIIANNYNEIVLDQDLNFVVDFGKLYDANFLSDLFFKINGVEPDEFKIEWAKQYIEKQFAPIEDTNLKNFDAIIEHIRPSDYFDLALCLFIYEKNHNTVDQNRLWSINNIPDTFDDALQFLKKNQKNYRIFKI